MPTIYCSRHGDVFPCDHGNCPMCCSKCAEEPFEPTHNEPISCHIHGKVLSCRHAVCPYCCPVCNSD